MLDLEDIAKAVNYPPESLDFLSPDQIDHLSFVGYSERHGYDHINLLFKKKAESWIHCCHISLAGSAYGLWVERAFKSVTTTGAAGYDATYGAKRTQQSTPGGRGKGGAV